MQSDHKAPWWSDPAAFHVGQIRFGVFSNRAIAKLWTFCREEIIAQGAKMCRQIGLSFIPGHAVVPIGM